MAERSIAAVLQDRLTEQGLVRTLARQDVSPQLVHELSPDEAAQVLQRSMVHPGPKARKAKKASKAKKVKMAAPLVKKAKKAKKAALDAPRKVGASAVRQVRPNYWKRVNKELHILICTNDQKYESLRRYIGKESRTTQVALVSSISATIGAYVGMAATVIGAFVTLGLMALLQVGKNAWCAGGSA